MQKPDKTRPWMHVVDAMLGEQELSGGSHNPRIVEMFRISGTPQFRDDETAWCAAFANAMLLCAGFSGTRSALASSFANFGADLGDQPTYGCVVLFHPLTAGASGHVSFFLRREGDKIICRGGNQNDAVRDTPFDISDVRAYKMPNAKTELPSTTLPTVLTLAPLDAPDHLRGGAIVRPPVVSIVPVDTFARIHPLIAKWEGGFSHHPEDTGGATNFGITLQRLSEARGERVTVTDVQNLTMEEALSIFKRYYYTPLRCAEMPISLAIMAYNTGVNSGPGRGALFLQRAINRQGFGLDEDGEVGPFTLTACSQCDRTLAVLAYREIYEAFYRSLATFPTFGNGWLNRLTDITPRALALVHETVQVVQPSVEGPIPMPQPTQTDMENIARALEQAIAGLIGVTQMLRGQQITGAPTPIAIPPPVLVPPPVPPPVVVPPAAVPVPGGTPGLLPGLLAMLGYVFANQADLIGAPIGPNATPAGTTTVATLIATIVGARYGAFVPLLTGLVNMLGNFAPKKP